MTRLVRSVVMLAALCIALRLTATTPTAQPAPGAPSRIISLVPATTEMLYAMGAGGRVVGVGSYDRFPPEIERLPKTVEIIYLANPSLARDEILLAIADQRADGRRSLHDLSIGLAVALGLGQALALILGVSRSGATISIALLLGFTRIAATRYSFLLAVPAVLVSGIYELRKIGNESVAWGPTLIATLLSFVVGLAVIHWLLKFVATHNFRWFIVYRIVLGATVFSFVAFGVVTAV